MAKEQPRFLAVLPWLQLAEEIEVGPFTFWRWPEDAEKYVPNQAERDGINRTVDKAFADMKQSSEVHSWKSVPLRSFCVISGKDGGCLFEDNEFRFLRKPVDALNACALFATNIQWFVSETDGEKYRHPNVIFYKNSTDFTLYRIPSESDSPYWSKAIQRRHGTEMHLGHPEPILKPAECTSKALNKNLPLLFSLGKLLESSKDDLSRRIFRALDLFTSAFTDSKAIHPYAEIVLLATVFEILLIPNYRGMDKCKELCLRFLALFQNNDEIKRRDKLRDGKEVEYPWKGWWLYWFYQLRNDIAHGEEIDPMRLLWSHNPNAGTQLEIAIGVLRLILMKILSKEGFHTPTDEDDYQSDRIDEFLSSDKYKSFPSENDEHYMEWWLHKRFAPEQ